MGFGYLLVRDGQNWCFPNEEQARTQAFPSDGIQLDQSQLQEQPDRGSDRKLYLYVKEVDLAPQDSQTLLPSQGGFQKKAQ
jgi:hypothetical protein